MDYHDDIIYKLWLNILCGHRPSYINKCLSGGHSPEEIFKSDLLYDKALSCLSLAGRIRARRSLDEAKQIYEDCMDEGISLISIDDKAYPERLKAIFAPPQILYVKGEMPDFDKLVCIAVVGSRKCSDYSRDFTYKIAYNLAKAGIPTISGMALGIDGAAHRGTLDGGNITVAVLAGGVDIVYPGANKGLYKEIQKRGAVISERPPEMAGRADFYKERNRIIAGLANGVLVTEGELSSGTKITANWASSFDRDLFAVPGKPDDERSSLPNELIKHNAKLVTSHEDIIEEYISVYPKELKYGIDLIKDNEHISEDTHGYEINALKIKPDIEAFDEKSKKIITYLYEKNDKIHIDEISRDCDISMTELSFSIIKLLMSGVIYEHPGQYYSAKK